MFSSPYLLPVPFYWWGKLGGCRVSKWIHLLNFLFVKVRKEFTSDIDSAISACRGISAVDSPCGHADLTQLFRVAAHEAKKSRSQNRTLRVVRM